MADGINVPNLQKMLTELDKISLTMNLRNSKLMNATEEPVHVKNGAALKYIQKNVYLCQKLSLHSNTEKEIERGIGLA